MNFLRIVYQAPSSLEPDPETLRQAAPAFDVVDDRETPPKVVLGSATSEQVLAYLGEAARERELAGRRKVLLGLEAEHGRAARQALDAYKARLAARAPAKPEAD